MVVPCLFPLDCMLHYLLTIKVAPFCQQTEIFEHRHFMQQNSDLSFTMPASTRKPAPTFYSSARKPCRLQSMKATYQTYKKTNWLGLIHMEYLCKKRPLSVTKLRSAFARFTDSKFWHQKKILDLAPESQIREVPVSQAYSICHEDTDCNPSPQPLHIPSPDAQT